VFTVVADCCQQVGWRSCSRRPAPFLPAGGWLRRFAFASQLIHALPHLAHGRQVAPFALRALDEFLHALHPRGQFLLLRRECPGARAARQRRELALLRRRENPPRLQAHLQPDALHFVLGKEHLLKLRCDGRLVRRILREQLREGVGFPPCLLGVLLRRGFKLVYRAFELFPLRRGEVDFVRVLEGKFRGRHQARQGARRGRRSQETAGREQECAEEEKARVHGRSSASISPASRSTAASLFVVRRKSVGSASVLAVCPQRSAPVCAAARRQRRAPSPRPLPRPRPVALAALLSGAPRLPRARCIEMLALGARLRAPTRAADRASRHREDHSLHSSF